MECESPQDLEQLKPHLETLKESCRSCFGGAFFRKLYFLLYFWLALCSTRCKPAAILRTFSSLRSLVLVGEVPASLGLKLSSALKWK